jgi:hypothetical protein
LSCTKQTSSVSTFQWDDTDDVCFVPDKIHVTIQWPDVVFGLFDIVVQEYDYLADVVFGLFDIVVQEFDYLAEVVFRLFDIVVANTTSAK